VHEKDSGVQEVKAIWKCVIEEIHHQQSDPHKAQ